MASLTSQLYLHAYPDGGTSRITNDFNDYDGVSASFADETIAALRTTSINNLWIAEASGGPARRLTSSDNPETSIFTADAGDTSTAIYVAPRDRYIQIWSIGARGGEARPLTTGDSHSYDCRSADGAVVFDRLDSSGVHVWRMDPDGSNPRQLTSGSGEKVLDLARDGLHVCCAYSAAPTKVSVLDTQDGRVIHENTDVHGTLGFSPDGRSLLIAKAIKDARGLTATLWEVCPIAGGDPSAGFRLPESASGMRWGPDSRSLTFTNRADPNWNIYRQAIDGRPVPVTRFTRGRVTGHQWSRDGRRLAVRVQIGDAANLWVVDSDGGHPVQVTQFTSETIFGFGWVPDSRRILLGAGTSTSDAVLVRDFR
jgi:Tol biopolymer transport system component